MKPWEKDKSWADHFLPEIKAILGQTFMCSANLKEDMEHNTDLIVIKMEAIRIACRLRSKEYYYRFPNEFTIRTSRRSGNRTELIKIIEGYGDYFFYGFCDDNCLITWAIGDLKVFRAWWTSYLISHGGKMPGKENKNKDNSSNFRAFLWHELPPNFIIAQKYKSLEIAQPLIIQPKMKILQKSLF